MKKFFLLALTGWIGLGCYAQNLSSSVIASSGNNGATTPQITWTIGEPIIATHSSGRITLTQGFHQTFAMVTGTLDLHGTELNLSLYPVPADQFLVLEFSDQPASYLSANLINVLGQTLEKLPTLQQKQSIPTNHLPAGNYFLQVADRNTIIQTYKIIIEH